MSWRPRVHQKHDACAHFDFRNTGVADAAEASGLRVRVTAAVNHDTPKYLRVSFKVPHTVGQG